MATAAQIEANRRNAQMSTGPKTEAGKARASLNSLKHGERAKVVVPVLPQEDPAGAGREDPPLGRGPAARGRPRARPGGAGGQALLDARPPRAVRDRRAGRAGAAGPAPVERGDRREGLRPGPEAAVQRGAADPARLRAPLGRQPGRLPVRARIDRRGLPLAAGAVDGARRHARARGHLDAHRPVPVDPPAGQAPGRRGQRPGPQPPDPGLGDDVAGGGGRLLGAVLPPDAEGGPGVPGVHGVARDRRQAGG